MVERGKLPCAEKKAPLGVEINEGEEDTRPIESIYESWDGSPLELVENGDKLIGLGACDMKYSPIPLERINLTILVNSFNI